MWLLHCHNESLLPNSIWFHHIYSKIRSVYMCIPEKNVVMLLLAKFSLFDEESRKSGDKILNLDDCNCSTIYLKC